MTFSPVYPASIASIYAGDRLRPVDPDRVAALAASMAEIGLQQPIVLRRGGEGENSVILVAGAHRLEAAKSLGWSEILASLIDVDAATARIGEIDENLVRNELSPIAFHVAVSERKRIHEVLYPGTRWGRASKSKTDGASKDGNFPSLSSFSKDAARRTGLSVSTFEKAATTVKRLTPEAVSLLLSAPITVNGSTLKKLSGLPAERQVAASRQLASGSARDVDDALIKAGLAPAPVAVDPEQKLYARWQETLSRTNATQRRALLVLLLKQVRTGEAAALANVLAEKLSPAKRKAVVQAITEAIDAHEAAHGNEA